MTHLDPFNQLVYAINKKNIQALESKRFLPRVTQVSHSGRPPKQPDNRIGFETGPFIAMKSSRYGSKSQLRKWKRM